MARKNEGAVYIAADIGNKLIKVVLITPAARGRWPTVVIPHALKELTDTKFEELGARMTSLRGGVTRAFHYETRMLDEVSQEKVSVSRNFVVGERAEGYGLLDRRNGPLKYERDYYAPLLLGALTELLPRGCDEIHMVAMFPPGEVAYVNNLRSALGGSHLVTGVDGEKAKYVIRSVRVIDEPVGGLMHRILGVDGITYNDHGIVGDHILVVDIGGQVSSMAPATADGDIDYINAKSFSMGIHDVETVFESELRKQHKKFRSMRVLPHDIVRAALKSGYWNGGGGDMINCTEAKDIAAGALLGQIRNIYENEMGGPMSFNHIIVTGGGGALLYDVLNSPYVLDHGSVSMADPHPSDMHLANVRGAAKMFISHLRQEKQWA